MVVKRVGALSLAKVVSLIYALLGLFFGALFSLITMAGAMSDSSEFGEFGALAGLAFGIGAVVFLPIFYGVLGFIFSLLMAGLYNLIAGVIGGVEIDVS